MSTTIPVPSRGALRALRHLALGTSCGLAVGAGLLTEERRRRIQSAREIHKNAQKIKSSRSYTAATAAIQTFEDQVLSYQDEEFWYAGNTPYRTALSNSGRKSAPDHLKVSSSSSKPPSARLLAQEYEAPFGHYMPEPPQRMQGSKIGNSSMTDRLQLPLPDASTLSQSTALPVPEVGLASEQAEPLPPGEDEVNQRQERLTYDVNKLLEETPSNVDDAATRFIETFEEGLPVNESGLSESLVNVAIKLHRALQQQSDLEHSNKVFDIVRSYGPIHEAQFYEFSPEAIIDSLLSRLPGDTESLLPTYKLERAASIYLTEFRLRIPQFMSRRMAKLGERLCRETQRSGLYSLTDEVFRRRLLLSTNIAIPIRVTQEAILAAHKLQHHKRAFKLFSKYYTKTHPDEVQHWKVTNTVVDSLLYIGLPDEAEAVLAKADEMAQQHGLTTSTTALLKVLGYDWRKYKSLARTTQLFERLNAFIDTTNHPTACYGAMIQFCIEAGDEAAADGFYSRLRIAHKVSSGDACIYGHFARAKAKRQDWEGVENEFRKMKRLAPNRHADLSASFTPVLKIYTESHSPAEAELFIQKFVDDYDLHLTGYMLNIMVNSYAKAKESDSIRRWIDYTSSIGCNVDSVFFNTMLNHCYESWKFSYQEINELFQSVRELDLSSRFIDKTTISILRRIADKNARGLEKEGLRELIPPAPSASVPDIRTVHMKMASTIKRRDFLGTLRIYVQALEKDVPLDNNHLSLAIKATLSLDEMDLDGCAVLIQDADRRGCQSQDAIAMVLNHQAQRTFAKGATGASEFVSLTKRAILDFEQRGIPVELGIITHTLSILQRTFNFSAALDFWNGMSTRLGFSVDALDLPTLTVLLNTYIGLRDASGIRWVLNILIANRLVPDQHFRKMLRNEGRRLRQLMNSGPQTHDMLQYQIEVDEACTILSAIGDKTVSEKENVKIMVIKILEKAIANQQIIVENGGKGATTVAARAFVEQSYAEGEDRDEADEEKDANSHHRTSLPLGAREA